MNMNRVLCSSVEDTNLLKAFKDYVNDYRVQMGAKPFGVVSNSASFDEKEQLVNAMALDKICEISKVEKDSKYAEANPMFKFAYNSVIAELVDSVLPEVVAQDFMGLAKVTPVGKGDSLELELKSNDLFEVYVNGNSKRHVNAQRQFTGTKTLVPTNHTVTTEVDFYRVRAGKESLAEVAMKMILSIEAEMALEVALALQNSFSALTANFKATGFTPQAFQTMAQRVKASNGGASAVALGTDVALANVLPSDNYLKLGLGEQYNQIGWLPVFMGVGVGALRQSIDWASADYDFAISDNYIYMVSPASQALVHIAIDTESVMIVDDEFANGNLVQKSSIHKGWAVAVCTNAKYGMIKLQ